MPGFPPPLSAFSKNWLRGDQRDNTHTTIPVLHKAGRGLPFAYDLTYDSSVWYPVGLTGHQTWSPISTWGWQGALPTGGSYITYSLTHGSGQCGIQGKDTYDQF